jgi:hypothetical protein
MRYLRHEYILLAASLVSALAWVTLRGFSCSIDIAACSSFTVVVFGYAIRKIGHNLFFGENAKSVTEIIFAHAVCLAALVMLLRTGMFASMLPVWLTIPVIADHFERLGPSGFQIGQGLALFLLGYFEFRVLTDPKKRNPEKEEKKANAARWRNAEFEAERMSSLRLP